MDRIELLITARDAASPALKKTSQEVDQLGAAAKRTSQALGGVNANKADSDLGKLRDTIGQAKEKAGGLSQGLAGLKTAFAALGVAALVQQLYSMGTALGAQALGLEKAQATAKLLAGDTARYNDVVRIARENQVLFGGSLQQNIAGLGSLAGQARKSGIELATLNDLSQRLNLLSPEQGLEGASIALREALSGDTQSLVERFELPRKELAKLRDTTLSAAERAEILNQVLEAQGVKAGAVAGTVSTTQKTYNLLARTMEDLSLVAGNQLAKSFETVSLGLAIVLERATNGVIILSAFADAIGRGIPIQQAWAEANGEGGRRMAEQLGLLPAVTTAQEAKTSADNAATAAQTGLAAQTGNTTAQQEIARVQAALLAQEQDALRAAAEAAALGSGTLEEAAIRLAAQFPITEAEAQILINTLRALNNASVAGAQRLDAQALQTRDLTGGAGVVAGAPGRTGTSDSEITRVAEEQKKARAEAERLAAANRRYTESTESGAQKVARLRKELGGLEKGTAAYREKQLELVQAESALAKSRERTGAKSAKTQSDQLAKEEERVAEHYQRLQRAQEDYELGAARSREDFDRQKIKLLAEGRRKEAQELEETFNIAQRRAREDFEKQQRRGSEDAPGGSRTTARTAARVRPGGTIAPAGGSEGAPAEPGPAGAPVVIQIMASVNLDGEKVGDLLAPRVVQRVDQNLTIAIEAIAVNPPGAGQGPGVSGRRP